ncbi:MAG: serine/threonine-protein kinase HipA [Gammaproteobacteria bacterium]|jgi:serine/threonine-protein kinase HipA
MSSCEVRLWDSAIGAVTWSDGAASFAYTPEFRQSGIQVAPLCMPLGEQIFRFPELARTSFHGLPGLVADSLPDKFGNAVIDAWLARQGRARGDMNPVERLAYTGQRGMGALEYWPAAETGAAQNETVEVAELVRLSNAVLHEREGFQAKLDKHERDAALVSLLSVGASAGGARAKAVVAWNRGTGEMRSGQTDAPGDFEHWLIKFDGVDGNSDKELADPLGFGLLEYAYSLMAKAAGITMAECLVLEESGRHHFMTKRFDRSVGKHPVSGKLRSEKLHITTLGGMAHLDFNQAGAHSYEQAFDVLRKLRLPMQDREQLFRRMAFNVLARNQDDHVKNIGFSMDKSGTWRLAPAYDLTFAYNPRGDWTARHQMSLNGKRDDFSLTDIGAVGAYADLARNRGAAIFDEVALAIGRWRDFAQEAGLPSDWAGQVEGQMRRL